MLTLLILSGIAAYIASKAQPATDGSATSQPPVVAASTLAAPPVASTGQPVSSTPPSSPAPVAPVLQTSVTPAIPVLHGRHANSMAIITANGENVLPSSGTSAEVGKVVRKSW